MSRRQISPRLLETFDSFLCGVAFEQRCRLLSNLGASELLVLALGYAYEGLAWLTFVEGLVHQGLVVHGKAELVHTMLCHHI